MTDVKSTWIFWRLTNWVVSGELKSSAKKIQEEIVPRYKNVEAVLRSYSTFYWALTRRFMCVRSTVKETIFYFWLKYECDTCNFNSLLSHLSYPRLMCRWCRPDRSRANQSSYSKTIFPLGFKKRALTVGRWEQFCTEERQGLHILSVRVHLIGFWPFLSYSRRSDWAAASVTRVPVDWEQWNSFPWLS